ncbi:MAG: hypothetical protein R6W71_13205 [Bacteroidales bacterium]|jgi:hypothetical protein
MIIQLYIFALVFIFIGILFFIRKKKLVGAMFFLLAILLSVVASVAIWLYPHIWPL